MQEWGRLFVTVVVRQRADVLDGPGSATSPRAVDRVVATTALVLASPLLGLAALAVWIDDRAPILYRAVRVGAGGRNFTMYKLRTMAVGVTGGGPITAADDPRILPSGRWIRRLKLDEIPQLFNVARGDMALVGPRPEDPSIVERWYTPRMKDTLTVLPGITSPGAVHYYRDRREDLIPAGSDAEPVYAQTLLPAKIALDLVYMEDRSALYDVALIARTLLAVVGGGERLFAHRERHEEERAAPIEAVIRRELTEMSAP